MTRLPRYMSHIGGSVRTHTPPMAMLHEPLVAILAAPDAASWLHAAFLSTAVFAEDNFACICLMRARIFGIRSGVLVNI